MRFAKASVLSLPENLEAVPSGKPLYVRIVDRSAYDWPEGTVFAIGPDDPDLSAVSDQELSEGRKICSAVYHMTNLTVSVSVLAFHGNGTATVLMPDGHFNLVPIRDLKFDQWEPPKQHD